MPVADFIRERLSNLWIAPSDRRVGAPAPEVVRWLLAVQAQDFSGSKWSLGVRSPGLDDAMVEQAFDSGQILRTHLLRPTWHFVTPEDLGWLLELTAPRVHAVNVSMYRKLELDAALLRRCQILMAGVLRGENHLTRAELKAVLEREGVVTDGQRLAYIMMATELDGVVCSGPRRGKQFTYALLEERAPGAKSLAREDALAELADRYFSSRGPATARDLAKWSGLTLSDARAAAGTLAASFAREEVSGEIYWSPPQAEAPEEPVPTIHLLSIYDEYFSSYREFGALATDRYAERLVGMGNALNYVILLDGRIVGSWRRTIERRSVVIQPNPFRSLSRAESRALQAAAERHGDFFGLSVTMTKS